MGILLFAFALLAGEVSTPVPVPVNVYADGKLYGGFSTSPGIGKPNAFVTKFDTVTKAVQWTTMLNSFQGAGVSVLKMGPDGYLYAAGVTTEPNFPTTPGAYIRRVQGDTLGNGGSVPYVVRLRPGDGSVVYSTLLSYGG